MVLPETPVEQSAKPTEDVTVQPAAEVVAPRLEEPSAVNSAAIVDTADDTPQIESVPAAKNVEIQEEKPQIETLPVVEDVPQTAENAPAEDVPQTVENAPAEDVPQTAEIAPAATADPVLPEYEIWWQKLVDAAAGETFFDLLKTCTPIALNNAVLSVKVPAAAMSELRSNRIKLLTLLQKTSGNWASLLDFQLEQAAEPAAAAVPVQPAAEPEAEPEAVMQEITADEIVETTVEYTEDFENPPTVSNFQHDCSNEATEQFIELNAEEDENMDVPQDMPSEFAYSRRSVIHKQEEVEAAAQLPPVQKVLDLFGGEIVDIHA